MTARVLIDQNHFISNLKSLQALNPQTKIIPVLKANAYGHGLGLLEVLRKQSCDYIAFASTPEGLAARKHQYDKPILILGANTPHEVQLSLQAKFTTTIACAEDLAVLSQTLNSDERKQKVHLKIDTGMNRAGIAQQDVGDFFQQCKDLQTNHPNLEIEGVYSHLICSEVYQHPTTYRQIQDFNNIYQQAKHFFGEQIKPHLFNSGAFIHYPNLTYSWARLGIALYGIYPCASLQKKVLLNPVLSWKAPIINWHRIAAGESVSYGQTFVAKQPTTVATLGIGYGEGLARVGSNGAVSVLYRGKMRPILGKICMDMTMIDLGQETPVIGEEVTLIGKDGTNSISAEDLAQKMQTIPYEVVCAISARNHRILVMNNGEPTTTEY